MELVTVKQIERAHAINETYIHAMDPGFLQSLILSVNVYLKCDRKQARELALEATGFIKSMYDKEYPRADDLIFLKDLSRTIVEARAHARCLLDGTEWTVGDIVGRNYGNFIEHMSWCDEKLVQTLLSGQMVGLVKSGKFPNWIWIAKRFRRHVSLFTPTPTIYEMKRMNEDELAITSSYLWMMSSTSRRPYPTDNLDTLKRGFKRNSPRQSETHDTPVTEADTKMIHTMGLKDQEEALIRYLALLPSKPKNIEGCLKDTLIQHENLTCMPHGDKNRFIERFKPGKGWDRVWQKSRDLRRTLNMI